MNNSLGRWAEVVKLSVLAVAMLLGASAWAQAGAAANDNFASAQVLSGDWGSVSATNNGATVEPNEPSHAGQAPTATLWYKWTASTDAPVEFDTFNSQVPTVLAVYVGSALANLNQVVANVAVNPVNPRNAFVGGSLVGGIVENNQVAAYDRASGVKFNAKRGTTYFIAVGSRSGGIRGAISLSWAYHSSGVFRWSADNYWCSETESQNPIPGNNAGESARGARLTVTRLFGTSGKVRLTFAFSDGTAVVGRDYQETPRTDVVLEDFEMSKSIVVPIVDDGSIVNGNPGRMGMAQPNRNFNVTLTGVALDSRENATVLSRPRLDTAHTNTLVTILDMDTIDVAALTNTLNLGNFERRHFRVSETVGNVRIPVFRVNSGGSGIETHYVIDSTTAPGSNTRYDYFDLEAGSDYASPSWGNTPASKNPDFDIPVDGEGNSLFLPGGSGVLSWGDEAAPKFIEFPIRNDGLPEFNEDIELYLFMMPGHTITQDLTPGHMGQAFVTIMYDDYPAGALDPSHNPDLDITTEPANNAVPGTDNQVYGLVVRTNDDKTIIVGNFSTFNTKPRYGIARINQDGSIDENFDPGDGVPVKSVVNPSFLTCVTLNATNKVVIGGKFPSYNGTPRYNIAQLNEDGSLDTSFNPGLGANGTVWSVAAQPDGKVLIGGEFTSVNGYLRSRIARLNADGTVDETFDPGTNGPNGRVNAIAVTPQGSIFIGGDFTTVGGLNRRSVALLTTNGVVAPGFNPVTGVEGKIHALALQRDGKLVIGGIFTTVELRSRNNIARYNADGTLDLNFDPGSGADDAVYALTLQADQRIILGGLFNSINQTRRMCVARLYSSGEVDTSFMDTAYNQYAGLHKPYFNPLVNPKEFLYTVGLQSDGNLMIGGRFRYVGGGRFTPTIMTNCPTKNQGGACDPSGLTRASYRVRCNVARLLGGDTMGPGSMNLAFTNNTIIETSGSLKVKAVRRNGALGQIEAAFSIPPRTGSNQVGVATSGIDYYYNAPNPRYVSSWLDPNNAGRGGRVRMLSNGVIGTNTVAIDEFNNDCRWDYDEIEVSIPLLAGYQGDRSAPFLLDVPSLADVFWLGGENIPLGSALGKVTGMVQIQETDTRPGAISFASPTYSVDEGDGYAVINLVRTNGSVGTVWVTFATTNGTAVAGVDYEGVTNTAVAFNDGETTAVVYVPITNDELKQQADRTVNLYLADPGNEAVLGGIPTAVLSIIDNDFLPGRINFTSVTYRTNETAPALVLMVTRNGGNEGTLDVQYATANQTAVAGVNYVATSGSLHWDDGDTSPRLITVPLLHDGLVMPDKQFTVTLSNPSVGGALGSRVVATCTSFNVDAYGKLQLSAPSYRFSENGGFATINVIRVGGSAETVSASFTTADGTAQSFLNYQPTNGSLIFNPGEVAKSITVRLVDDGAVNGANFFFNVQLGAFSPASASGSPISAVVNLTDAQFVEKPAGQIDTYFNPDAGFDNDVYALVRQPDGRLVAAGDFTSANGLPINRLARLSSTGVLDQSFLVSSLGGANGAVRALISQTDTRLVVGGTFTRINGVVRNLIARLNYDGSLDTGFNPGSGTDGTVFALAETFDGVSGARQIMVGGAFTTFSGALRAGIVRLNNDGTVDTSFNNGSGANGTVYSVAVYPTNSLFAGQAVIAGDFTQVNGIARTRVARLNLDGSVDTSFNPGAGVNGAIRAVVIQPDGKVLLGGQFSSVNGVACTRLARLNKDGSLDTTFQPGLGANDSVYTLVLQPDNRILVGGEFTRASGVTRNRLTRLMPDGTVDPTINFGMGANSFVSSIVLQPDNDIVVAGGFTEFQGEARARLARIYGGAMTGSGSFKLDASIYPAEENSTNLLVTVIRSGGTSGPLPDGSGAVTVDFATSDGSALAGVNYGSVRRTLTFPVGETMQQVFIPLIDDLQITPDLAFDLALANPSAPAVLGPQPTAVVQLLNVESAVAFAAADFSRNEDAIDGFATIQLVRTGSLRTTVTVDFATTGNGTAIPAFNYTPVATTLTFLPGQSQQLVRVPLLHTPVSEGDTTVSLELNNPLNTLLLAPFQAMLTIVDVDIAPGQFVFSQTNYVTGEGDGNALISVVRTNGRSGVVSVAFSTLADTATPGLKFVPTNGILTFADNEKVKSFAVRILEENQVEGAQTVKIALANPTGGATIVGDNPVPLIILDNDVGLSFGSYVYIASETNDLVTLDVLRLNSTNGTTHVTYATTNGTAMAGVNYSAASGTLTFIPGETRKSISVPLVRDPRVTGDLTFSVVLSNPDNGAQLAVPSTANVVVLDVDSGLRFADIQADGVLMVTNTVMENAGSFVVTVLRTNANTGSIQVNYSAETVEGVDSAQEIWDYVAASGVLTFTNNQLSNSFTVPIVDNTRVDGDRSFTVRLFNPTAPAQLLNPSVKKVIIVDNDSGFRLSSESYEIMENGARLPVTVLRSGSTNSSVTINFSTQDGSAKAGVDYTATNCVLNFKSGELSKTVMVEVRDDTLLQGDRAFNVVLSQPSGNGVLVAPSAAAITIHDNDGSLVIPAGVALTAESQTPVDGVIQPGETVTVLFAFRNAAGSNTANLVATLLATNGVSSPSAPQSYGALAVEGPSASRPFTFTANGTNGQRIAATFQLQDSGRLVGTNAGLAVFSFTIGTSTASFSTNGLITINDMMPASPYPAYLDVTNLDGLISKVTVTLSNVNHKSPADMDVLLVAPTSKATLLMANAGSTFGLSKATLSFDDAAAAALPQDAPITSGTFKPSVYDALAPFPTPAPPAPYPSSLSTFNGSNPNGRWNLFIIDDLAGDTGAISNGWQLNFTVVNPVSSAADLALGMKAASASVVLSSNITYTLSVTNFGPGSASAVRVTNTLPAGTAFVAATPSQGTASTNGAGQLVWSLGAMAKDATASLSLSVQALTPGLVTNAAVVTAASSDLNPDEDRAQVVTTVIAPSADLALSLVGTPNPVLMGQSLTYSLTVSNLGPGTATGVALVDTLPAGVRFLAASPVTYSLNGSSLTFTNLGSLPSGGTVTATILVQALGSGTLTNIVSCASLVTDPYKPNNNVAIKTVVSAVPLALSLSGGSLTVSWPLEAGTYSLESATNLIPPVIWTPVTDPAPTVVNGEKRLSLPMDNSHGKFFRLRAPAP